MVIKKLRVNLFDIIVFLAILVLIAIVAFGWNNTPYLGNHNLLVSVKTIDSQSIKNILSQVEESNNKQVFYSGTEYPVIQKSYSISKNSNGEIDELTVVLDGLGDITDNNSIFNGQRVYDNQKVEIRSDYYIQGFVTDFRYED